MPYTRDQCDWCGGKLLKMRNGKLKHVTGDVNFICDACWKEHVRKRKLREEEDKRIAAKDSSRYDGTEYEYLK